MTAAKAKSEEEIPAMELEKTTLRTVFLFLATLLRTLLVPLTAGSIRSLCKDERFSHLAVKLNKCRVSILQRNDECLEAYN